MSAETKRGSNGLTLHPVASTVYEGARCRQWVMKQAGWCEAPAVWMGVPPHGGPYVYLLCDEHARPSDER